jgi:translation initiation factor 1
MGKKHQSARGSGGSAGGQGDRTVYREFGSAEALERPQPEMAPSAHNLRLQVSRKGRGGKTVTVIGPFQLRPETLKALLKTLKAHCGSGGATKGDSLEIQGDHRQKLLPLLTQLGYPAKLSGG